MNFDPLTFVFELVNFVVLAMVLQRLVYRPIAASIQARREEITQTREAAANQLEAVQKQAEALEIKGRGVDQLRESIFAEATAAAATERAKLMATAREDAAAEREKVQALLESERQAALGWVREVTVDRGVEVAGRLLLELVPDAAHSALVQRLIHSLADHAELLGQAEEGEVVHAEASFAKLATAEETLALKQALEASVRGAVRLAVSEDERLGAGLVVRVQDRVFDASVAGQLEMLKEEAHRAAASGEAG